jgi:leucyl/phenylalanyl-tRNA--protein transferase
MKKAYIKFLDTIVVRLFISRERAIISCFNTKAHPSEDLIATAIRCAYDAMKPTPERVIANYFQGFILLGELASKNENKGLRWVTFPERAIITPESAHIPKRVREYTKSSKFEIKRNENFEEVVRRCQREERTWINKEIIDIYTTLFSMGFAHSVEIYQGQELVGGLWGLVVGRTFALMSMFHSVKNSGAISMGILVSSLETGQFRIVDCGKMNNNFVRYGAYAVPREEFISKVARELVPIDTMNCFKQAKWLRN